MSVKLLVTGSVHLRLGLCLLKNNYLFSMRNYLCHLLLQPQSLFSSVSVNKKVCLSHLCSVLLELRLADCCGSEDRNSWPSQPWNRQNNFCHSKRNDNTNYKKCTRKKCTWGFPLWTTGDFGALCTNKIRKCSDRRKSTRYKCLQN